MNNNYDPNNPYGPIPGAPPPRTYPQVPPPGTYPPPGQYPQGGQKTEYNTLRSFGEIFVNEKKKLVFSLLQVIKPGMAPSTTLHVHEYYLGQQGWRPGRRATLDKNTGQPRTSIVFDIELGKVNEWAGILTAAAGEIAAGYQAGAGPQGVGGMPSGPPVVPFPPTPPPPGHPGYTPPNPPQGTPPTNPGPPVQGQGQLPGFVPPPVLPGPGHDDPF